MAKRPIIGVLYPGKLACSIIKSGFRRGELCEQLATTALTAIDHGSQLMSTGSSQITNRFADARVYQSAIEEGIIQGRVRRFVASLTSSERDFAGPRELVGNGRYETPPPQ